MSGIDPLFDPRSSTRLPATIGPTIAPLKKSQRPVPLSVDATCPIVSPPPKSIGA